MKNSRSMTIAISCMLILSSFTACGSDNTSKSKDTHKANELEGIIDDNEGAGDDVGAEGLEDGCESAGAEVNKEAGLMEGFGAEGSLDIVAGGCVVDTPEPENSIEADSMILTAGRWNDLDNWGFFTNLVNSGTISFPSFGLNPCNMLEVTLTNSGGVPLQGKLVELITADGDKVWSTYSDKDGKAHLFNYDKHTKMKVLAYENEKDYEEKIVDASNNSGQQGGNVDSSRKIEIELDGESIKNDSMQIMFIVDTTGSMGDELTFLQKDFSSIMNEVGTDSIEYSVNFYRDAGDDYVTKCNSFSSDTAEIQSALNAEAADGGGDTPEAVAEILNETMNSTEWMGGATKLAFMIFDAPPHDDKNTEIEASIKTAASKGIHLIPIVSSNSERETELFGRALAIMTNGEYVFLTDDSGVGDSHLEPIIGDYEVQKLHDIVIDIINKYK